MTMKSDNSRNGNMTMWFIVGFVLVITVAVIFLVARPGSGTTPDGNQVETTIAPDITVADWKKGNAAAKVSVIEYGDFQCPACVAYNPFIAQLLADYGDRVVFVFRNFPLYQIHKNATISAQAAEAAGLQGKYWEMYDLLYDNQSDWASESAGKVVDGYFAKYAESLGLDLAKFRNDIDSAQVKEKITSDAAGANAAKVDHTPTFFVNLKQIPNPRNYNDFKSLIEAELAS